MKEDLFLVFQPGEPLYLVNSKERLLQCFASKEIPRCNVLNERVFKRVFTRAFTFPGLKEIKAEDIDIVIKEKSE